MDERVAGAMGAASAPGLPAAAGVPSWVNTRSRNHTWTGLRLMIFGFALFWVPVLSYVGAVLLLAGVMFVFAGRRAFNDAHRRWVTRGTALLLAGVIGEVVVAIFVDLEVSSTMVGPAEPLAQALASLQQDLVVFVVGSFATAVVAALGFVSMPYGRADVVSRGILWGGFAAAGVIAAIEFGTFWTEYSAAISAAQSGTLDTTAIQNVPAQLLWFGIAEVVPYVLFLWGYLRVRSRLFPGGKRAARASIRRDLRLT